MQIPGHLEPKAACKSALGPSDRNGTSASEPVPVFFSEPRKSRVSLPYFFHHGRISLLGICDLVVAILANYLYTNICKLLTFVNYFSFPLSSLDRSLSITIEIIDNEIRYSLNFFQSLEDFFKIKLPFVHDNESFINQARIESGHDKYIITDIYLKWLVITWDGRSKKIGTLH